LPRGETFNWVDRVSIELTTSMLATLFDFPFEDRRKLTFWSDCATMNPKAGGYIDSEEKREEVFREILAYFVRLWNERVNGEPRPDLVSMLAHGEATRNMSPREYLGNLILLMVGGNDTTRNSISGDLLFLNQNPGEYAKLRTNPGLIDGMVPEIIRYQTPLALRQSRRGGDRTAERVYHRPGAATPGPLLRLRHPSLCRKPVGGAAAQDHVGGDSQALPADRGRGARQAHILKLRARLCRIASSHTDLKNNGTTAERTSIVE